MTYQITEEDIYLFHQGTHYHSYHFLGSHHLIHKGKEGFRFTVWAPHAKEIYVVGDFNNWNNPTHPLKKISKQGLWSGFFTDIKSDTTYKYKIITDDKRTLLKADPYAVQAELRPHTASITSKTSTYQWNDTTWQKKKSTENPLTEPLSIYEVHLGSWKTHAVHKLDDGGTRDANEFYTYRELAHTLIPYVKSLGFTHIEVLPLAEHPFDLSWGYQITGYYAVTSRYGLRDDFKYFVDQCHKHHIGVIMDWVPGHFCKDDFGLRQFDGTPLYEYADPRKAEKTLWGTLAFDFGRPEVQSFLISNALYWLEEYHIDGIRVDAVASMLSLNFDKSETEEKIFNVFGGDENLEAYAFLQKLNKVVFSFKPQALMIAEDSSDTKGVTSPVYTGGLGFNLKWNMGWMNDMLSYMKHDPIHRKWHHHLLTFSFMYTHSENFVLPLSHDEVVHGKKALLDKMPGDQWQQFANLRLLYGYMMVHPGKKLLFMGGELAQYAEWKDKEQLDWHLLKYPLHRSMKKYVEILQKLYLKHPELYEYDHDPSGFEWIDPHNNAQSIIAFMRKNKRDKLIIICNFTPEVYFDYKVGVSEAGKYQEIFNSDHLEFGGSGQLNEYDHYSIPEKWHGFKQHIKIKVPPLAMSVFKRQN